MPEGNLLYYGDNLELPFDLAASTSDAVAVSDKSVLKNRAKRPEQQSTREDRK